MKRIFLAVLLVLCVALPGLAKNIGGGQITVGGMSSGGTTVDPGGTGLVYCTYSGGCTFTAKAIGTDVQAYNASLASLAGLTLAAGDTLYSTGAATLTNLAKGAAYSIYMMNAGDTAPSWVTPVNNSLFGCNSSGVCAFQTAFSFDSGFFIYDVNQGTTTPKKMNFDTSASSVSTTFTEKSYIVADHWIKWDLSGATASKNPTFVLPVTNDRSYTFPDYAGTLATLAGTETMTNKTFSGYQLVITTSGLTQDNMYYMTSGGSWALADANGTGTYPGRCYAISTTQCMIRGSYTKTSHGLTVGANFYLSDTAGAISNTPSTTTVQALGWALDANTLIFSIGADYVAP